MFKDIIVSYSLLETIANLLIVIKYELLKTAYKQQKKDMEPKPKPMVIAVNDESKSCYIILGSNGQITSHNAKTKKK